MAQNIQLFGPRGGIDRKRLERRMENRHIFIRCHCSNRIHLRNRSVYKESRFYDREFVDAFPFFNQSKYVIGECVSINGDERYVEISQQIGPDGSSRFLKQKSNAWF